MCPRVFHAVFALAFLGPSVIAQQSPAPNDSTSLAICNGNLSVVHTTIELNLQPGLNDVSTTEITRLLEPDSVLLTDPAARTAAFQIIEQNYEPDNNTSAPGKPPTLRWQIQSEKSQNLHAELTYITGGLSWQASYNAIVSEPTDVTGDQRADILGWVTLGNQSGRDFPAARVKLMAGDVTKIQPEGFGAPRQMAAAGIACSTELEETRTRQTASDDFHFYDLNQRVDLPNGETKQVQYLSAMAVNISRGYAYDGASTNPQPFYANGVNEQQQYGLDETRTKVNITQEIRNTSANHLGIPLPPGGLRLYRREPDGRIELVGESLVPYTPTDGSLKIVSGDASDLRGARTQTDFHVNESGRTVDETIQIKLTNQKTQPIVVTVVEHLYRGKKWEITDKSADYTRVDSNTIQFPIQVPAKGQSDLTYSVRYSW